MDKRSKVLDDPNMPRRADAAVRDHAPTYALYGEDADFFNSDMVHCEALSARSVLYDWRIGLHRHPSLFQILHIVAGRGAFLLSDARIAITPPMLIIVPAGVVHGFEFTPDIEGRVITVVAERVDRIAAASRGLSVRLGEARAITLGADAAAAAASADAIARECAAAEPGRLAAIEAHLALLLVAFIRALSREAGTDDAPQRLARHAAALRAAIEKDFRRAHALSHYARALAVSPTHLNRIARAAFGTSALALLHRRLVNEAMRELTFTTAPVKSIAYALGFEDPAYFTRLFTRLAGCSPTRFRRSRTAS
jgi:AraC family transcriptional activator of pobA